MGVSIHGGIPKRLVYFMENPIYQKWMITGGTPMTVETSNSIDSYLPHRMPLIIIIFPIYI
jgi:hypothetical protein